MENDWKKRLGVVYSTSNDYEFDYEKEEEQSLLPPGEQRLTVMLDRKNRKGKAVTLITGFVGPDEALKQLAKELKTSCGVGGSSGDGEILIQGDQRDKVVKKLQEKGYRVKRSGG